MTPAKELVQKIGDALARQSDSAELEALAAEYAKLSRVTNKRLELCGEMLAAGKRENALAMAESTPSVFGAAAALRCGDATAWRQFCQQNNLPVPELFNEEMFLKLEVLHVKPSLAKPQKPLPRPPAIPAHIAPDPAPASSAVKAAEPKFFTLPQMPTSAPPVAKPKPEYEKAESPQPEPAQAEPTETPLVLAAIVPDSEMENSAVADESQAVMSVVLDESPAQAPGRKSVWLVATGVTMVVMILLVAGGMFWWWSLFQTSDETKPTPVATAPAKNEIRETSTSLASEKTNAVVASAAQTNAVPQSAPALPVRTIPTADVESKAAAAASTLKTNTVAAITHPSPINATDDDAKNTPAAGAPAVSASARSRTTETNTFAQPLPAAVPIYVARESLDGILLLLQQHCGASIGVATLPQICVVRTQRFARGGWPNPISDGMLADWSPDGSLCAGASQIARLNAAGQLVAQDKSSHWAIRLDPKASGGAGASFTSFQILLLAGQLLSPPLRINEEALLFRHDGAGHLQHGLLAPAVIERLRMVRPVAAGSQVRLVVELREKGVWSRSFTHGNMSIGVQPDGQTFFASPIVSVSSRGGLPLIDLLALRFDFAAMADYYAKQSQEMDRRRKAMDSRSDPFAGTIISVGNNIVNFPSSGTTWEDFCGQLKALCCDALMGMSNGRLGDVSQKVDHVFKQVGAPPLPTGLDDVPDKLLRESLPDLRVLGSSEITSFRIVWQNFTTTWKRCFSSEVMLRLRHVPTRRQIADIESQRDQFLKWSQAIPDSQEDVAGAWLEWRPSATQQFVRLVEFRKTET